MALARSVFTRLTFPGPVDRAGRGIATRLDAFVAAGHASGGGESGGPVCRGAGAARRRFTAEYKLRVLRQADAGAGPGDLGRCCGGRGCTRRT